MSKISRIEMHHVCVPMSTPFYPSWIPGYPQTQVRFNLIRLYTEDGRMGEAAGNAFGEEREGLGKLIGPFLLGMDDEDIEGARKRLREASYLGWRNAWIENAFWDMKGKRLGKPVYKLLQTEEHTVERAPVYASTGELRSIERRRDYLDLIRSMGIKAVKIRVHDPAMKNDLDILKQVRAEVGEDFVIGVDANQGWPVSLIKPSPTWDLEYATAFGKGCEELSLAWIEEPLDMHDWAGMAELRCRVKVPIAGGELHGAWHEIQPLFEHGCLDKYQPDVTFSGYSVALRVMAECRTRSLAYSPHTWTNGIGLVENLHAFAAWEKSGYLEYPFEPPGWIPEFRDGIIPPIEVNPDGTVDVPQEPGLGLRIDERRLRRFGRCFYVATPLRVALGTIKEKGLKTALEIKKAREG